MKKWQRMSLSFGLATSLIVPSVSSAAMPVDVKALKDKAEADLEKQLKLSASESKGLNFEKQQDKQDVLSKDTIIVKYETKLQANVHRKSGAILERTLPALGYDIVKLAKGQKLADVLSFYANQAGVISATPSVTYTTFNTNADPKKNKMYHLSLLNIDKALSLAGDNPVTVAVIDSGVDAKHPELKSKVLPPYNVLSPANQPFVDVHGTHVAGIIASEQNNAVGGHGVNPNAKILPIDVFGGGWGASDYSIAEGILYAVNQGADVINMSLGGSMESPIMKEAVQKAIDAGVTVVAAAGNNYGESISYPAAYEGVIAVSATNSENKLAQFSSYGAFVDIAAPGDAIYNTVFDYLKGSSYGEMSGTSMASPIVAGVASLLLSKHPDLKPHEVEAILKMTANDLGDKGYDTKFGNGLVNPVKALEFDLKNLPKFDLDQAAAKVKATELTSDKAEFTNKLGQPGETHWFKVKLEAGQGVQALLDGAKQFNYKLLFDFQPTAAEGKATSLEVNDSLNGKQEGSFFVAKEAGTLYVGVKDVYGHYDLNGQSHYTLSLQKEKELLIDNVTAENPIVIEKLPFNSADTSTLTFAVDPEAKEADKDYFRFSVTEPTMVEFELSAIPGINSSMAAYFEEDFLRGVPQDLPPGMYYEIPMLQYANSNGIGEGEKITLEAMPGMNYLIEVSSEPRRDYWYEMIFGAPVKKSVANSNTPYTVKAKTVELEADEDGFPKRYDRIEEELLKGEITPAAYQKKATSNYRKAMEQAAEQQRYWRYAPLELMDMIRAGAVQTEIGAKIEGKFQFAGDEDFYKFTADADAIYKFELGRPTNILPWVTIMEYDSEHNDFIPVTSIYTYGMMWGEEPQLSRAVALEKGKEYYIRFVNERYQANDEKYVLSSEKLMDVPDTNDQDENKPIRSKVLNPGEKDLNHIIYSNDLDYYYYSNKGKAENHLSLTLKQQRLTEQQKATLPKELQGALIPYIAVIEDTNGNMEIDDIEYSKAFSYGPNSWEQVYNLQASFRVKKDTNYFIVVQGYHYDGMSIQPYEIALHNWNVKDEDASSVVKNNVPSAPLALKATADGFTATGYFNPGVAFGDKDYYALKVDRNSKFDVSLETSLDGVIWVFDTKGKKLARLDNYGAGDNEVGTITLPKGNYYIMVEDANGNSSLDPYKLVLKKK